MTRQRSSRHICAHCGTPLTRRQMSLRYITCSRGCSLARQEAGSPWRGSRTAILRRLWDEGVPAVIIARTLGEGATICGVIGKARRLNLKGRGGMVRNPRRIDAFQQPSMPLQFKPSTVHEPTRDRLIIPPKGRAKPLPLPPELPAPKGSKTFMEVGAHECRYPYGDPRDLSTFRFCGQPAVGSWCGSHNIWEPR